MLRVFNEKVPKDEELIKHIVSKILSIMKNVNSDDWRINMIANQEIYQNSKNTKEAFENSILFPIQTSLTKVLCVIEKVDALNSYFTPLEKTTEVLNKEIWLNYFDQISININICIANTRHSLLNPYDFALKFPFSTIEFTKVQKIRKDYFHQDIVRENLFIEFKKHTVIGNLIEKFEENILLQNLYFNDLLLILLKDLFYKSESYCLLFFNGFIFNLDSFITKTFEAKFIFFIEGQDLFVMLLKLLHICSLEVKSLIIVLPNYYTSP